jgi:hypothetical protein
MNRFRTLLLIALFALTSVSAFGTGVDRDILLTDQGVLYTVESRFTEDLEITSESLKVLQLSIQQGDKVETILVPATLTGGNNSNAALTYDTESQTLFVIWQRTPSPRLSSDLLIVSFKDGKWSPPVSIDNAAFEIRYNLRIATTRFLIEQQPDGTVARKQGFVIHVVWWAETGHGETPGYAMIAFDNGAVRSIQTADLVSLLGPYRNPGEVVELDPEFDLDLFRNPAIFESITHDAVEMIFADMGTNRFQRMAIRPIRADGVLTPPIGIWQGAFGPPKMFRDVVESSRISILPGADPSKMIFHYRTATTVDYLSVSGSTWSERRSIALNDRVSAETAVEALRRLITSQ